MVDDMVNAGAKVIDAPVVIDDNIITCSYYAWVEAFMRTVLEATRQRSTSVVVPAGK
jgi:protease I